MKLIIVLLFFLISIQAMGQIRKDDAVIEFEPKVFDMSLNKSQRNIGFASSFHYYLTDKLAIGCGLSALYTGDSTNIPFFLVHIKLRFLALYVQKYGIIF